MSENQLIKPVILVVDDDHPNLNSLEKIFKKERYIVHMASDGSEALEKMRKNDIDIVLTDLKMPGFDGAELLKTIKKIKPEVEVVMMTAYGTVENAVSAMKHGAYDFITKPIKRLYLVKTVKKALEKQALVLENIILKNQLAAINVSKKLVGQSPTFRETMDTVSQAAASSATILLEGESGTGKELIARSIHDISPRRQNAFIAINCGALPETILESELFGHEKGAFTGAESRRKGRFELADKGTLFLDEVGEMSTSLQVKLLRVLQEGEFERLGGSDVIKVDVRIVAATKRDLAEEVKLGNFRDDLFYRLNVISVNIPALRFRKEDIILLADHSLKIYIDKNNKNLTGISRSAIDILQSYSWPGNVRELENTMERAVVLTKDSIITPDDLPNNIKDISDEEISSNHIIVPLGTSLDEIELKVIKQTLKAVGGDKNIAARLLGIASRTIYRKMGSDVE